jgi:hypothetical protein
VVVYELVFFVCLFLFWGFIISVVFGLDRVLDICFVMKGFVMQKG